MSNTKTNQWKGVLYLLTTAFVWGVAFVAQSEGMKIGGFTFNGVRMFLAGLILIPVILVIDRKNRRDLSEEERKACRDLDKKTIRSGMILGLILCAASNFQQYAFAESSSGKIAFITTTYMFFVPLLGLFLGKRVSRKVWLCVLLGFVGLFFLCMDPNDLSAVNGGDVLALIGAVLFAVHTLAIEKFAPNADGLKLSSVQFLVAGCIGMILMFLFEEPSWQSICSAYIPILYAACMGCGIGYTFQVIGQKYVEATVASLLLSLESVFAVLAGAVLLHEVLLGREILGCTIMFAAIILAQLSDRKPKGE